MNVSLSIDWDFFFNFTPYNWVYAENEFFKTWVWDLRLLMQPALVKELVPHRSDEFWQKLQEIKLIPSIMCVAEHHLYAYHMFRDTATLDLMLHFDNHSDMSVRNFGKIDSGNWLFELMRLKPKLKAIWIMPDHCKGETIHKSIGPDRFKQIHWSDLGDIELRETKVQPSFICRSSTWTPPWSDEGFQAFVKEPQAKIVPLSDSPLDLRSLHFRTLEESGASKAHFLSSVLTSRFAGLGLEAVKSLLRATIGVKGTRSEPVV